MSNALSTVTRGSMKKVSRCPGSPGSSHYHIQPAGPDTTSCADPRTSIPPPPGFVLERPPAPQAFLPPTAVAAVTLAFPLSVPSLVVMIAQTVGAMPSVPGVCV